MEEQNTGRITQIIGAVLDIRFSHGHLPEINDAVCIVRKDGTRLTAEDGPASGRRYGPLYCHGAYRWSGKRNGGAGSRNSYYRSGRGKDAGAHV